MLHGLEHIPLLEQYVPQFVQIRIGFYADLLDAPSSANANFALAPVLFVVKEFHEVVTGCGGVNAGSGQFQRIRCAARIGDIFRKRKNSVSIRGLKRI